METLLFFLLFKLLNRLLIQPLGRLSDLLKAGAMSTRDFAGTASLRTGNLTEISNLLSALVDYQRIRHIAEMADLAKQVSHDIRSPLVFLDSLIPTLTPLPENTRVMARKAINRIRDIANMLLAASKNIPSTPSVSRKLETRLLFVAVESLISQKRQEYLSRPGITLDSTGGDFLYGVFVEVDPVEFDVVLSNLINNAVDAIKDSGIVQVIVSADSTTTTITVRDNGCGIPSEIVRQLDESPFSYNKPNGKGLGLKHAKSQLKEWKGWIEISSRVGEGTGVRLRIPRAVPPRWYVPEIDLQGIHEVTILDDDSSIHGIWKNRFAEILSRHSDLKMNHAYSAEDFGPLSQTKKGCIFLVDYELSNSLVTGLDLIEQYQLVQQSILVTSRWDESALLSRATQMGLRILPKEMATRIPIVSVAELSICPESDSTQHS